MGKNTVRTVLDFLAVSNVETLDLTGGAPEMNPHFHEIVTGARTLGITVMDRCNLTILEEPGYEGMAAFLAENQVEVIASLPCYLEDNVNAQRGKGVFGMSMDALKRLNTLGYGEEAISEPCLQPPRANPATCSGGSGGNLQGGAETSLRHCVQPPVHHH